MTSASGTLAAMTLAGAMAGAPAALAEPSPPDAATAAAVGEVVVTAQRPTQQILLDRKTYSIGADLQATTGTAADVLNKIPSVNVDADGVLSVRGDSNVTVLVDGKPSAQFNGSAQAQSLQQFPANEIDRVEVLTHPPAQYKSEGSGGVINIITRKTRRRGFTGTARANLGDEGRFVLGFDGAYNASGLRLSGGVGLRREVKERVISSDRTTADPLLGPVRALQTSDERFRRLIPSAQFDAAYDLDPSQTLGASFSHRELSGDRNFDQHDASGVLGAAATDISDRFSAGHEWSMSDSKGLNFEQKLWRPQETLNLAFQRSATRERERYAYTNTFDLPPADPSYDDLRLSLDLVETTLAADYDLPLPGERDLKLGYAYEGDRNAYDNVGDTRDPATGVATINPDVTNHFRYRQDVQAAYGDYRTPLGRWNLDAGLRIEATRVATHQITGEVFGGWHDLAAYPTLHLERDLGDDDKLSAAIARRVTRPDPQALNPFADHQDTHNLRAGDPNLRPQQTWSVEAGYAHSGALNYGATVYYRLDRNSVTDIVTPISDDVVLTTKANLPLKRSGGLEFNLGGKLARTLAYGLSGDAFYTQIDGRSLGAPGLQSNTGVNLKLSLDYRPTRADSAQLSISRTARKLTPQGSIGAINLVNLGYKHDFRPDLSAIVTVSDLLNSQKLVRENASPGFSETYSRHQYGRIAYVGMVYTFGGPKKEKAAFEYEP